MTFPATAMQIASAVRAGEITASDVADRFLGRIAEANPSLHAIVAGRVAGARADAAAIDLKIASGVDPGRLAGVPFTVKDIIVTADLPTTCGSRAVAGIASGIDAPAVARLRAAGAVLVGKTNTPEFAFGIDTVNERYGRTGNPLGPFTVGGSSGGEAAAVAAGMSAFGIGSDFGGSLRWPAQCCGLVGMRPGLGTVPNGGQLPAQAASRLTLQALVQTIGPITTDVADASLVLSVLANGDRVADRGVSGIEVLWGSTLAGVPAAPEVRDAVAGAVRQLAARGATVADEGLPRHLDEAAAVYSTLRAADSHEAIRAAVSGREHLLERRNRDLLAGARNATPSDPAREWRARQRLVAQFDRLLEEDRVMVLPVATVSPAMATSLGIDDFGILIPSRAVSLLGLPAMSVPWGRADDGSPLSVQIVAGRRRESLLFAVAKELERMHG